MLYEVITDRTRVDLSTGPRLYPDHDHPKHYGEFRVGRRSWRVGIAGR